MFYNKYLLLICYFTITYTLGQSNKITDDKLVSTIKSDIEKYIPEPWVKIEISYLKAKNFGSYGISFWNKKKKEDVLTPDEYNFSFELDNTLSQFVEQKNKEKKCNRLIVTILPKGQYKIETSWDEESYLLDLRMEEGRIEDELNLLSTETLEIPIDTLRYVKGIFVDDAGEVLSLPIENETDCKFFVRLFSLLGEPDDIGYEGFSYHIYDKEKDLHFSASLSASGSGYYSNDDSEKTKNIIREFHNNLFSKQLILKECSMEYEHDFGKSTLGFKNGTFICN